MRLRHALALLVGVGVGIVSGCTSSRAVHIENGDRALAHGSFDVALENYDKALRESSTDAERSEAKEKLDDTNRAIAAQQLAHQGNSAAYQAAEATGDQETMARALGGMEADFEGRWSDREKMPWLRLGELERAAYFFPKDHAVHGRIAAWRHEVASRELGRARECPDSPGAAIFHYVWAEKFGATLDPTTMVELLRRVQALTDRPAHWSVATTDGALEEQLRGALRISLDSSFGSSPASMRVSVDRLDGSAQRTQRPHVFTTTRTWTEMVPSEQLTVYVDEEGRATGRQHSETRHEAVEHTETTTHESTIHTVQRRLTAECHVVVAWRDRTAEASIPFERTEEEEGAEPPAGPEKLYPEYASQIASRTRAVCDELVQAIVSRSLASAARLEAEGNLAAAEHEAWCAEFMVIEHPARAFFLRTHGIEVAELGHAYEELRTRLEPERIAAANKNDVLGIRFQGTRPGLDPCRVAAVTRPSDLRVGDVVLEVEGREVRSVDELWSQTRAADVPIALTVERGGARTNLVVTPSRR